MEVDELQGEQGMVEEASRHAPVVGPRGEITGSIQWQGSVWGPWVGGWLPSTQAVLLPQVSPSPCFHFCRGPSHPLLLLGLPPGTAAVWGLYWGDPECWKGIWWAEEAALGRLPYPA